MLSLLAFSMKDQGSLDQGPTLMTPYNLNYFFIPNTATMGVMTSTYEVEGEEPHWTFSP